MWGRGGEPVVLLTIHGSVVSKTVGFFKFFSPCCATCSRRALTGRTHSCYHHAAWRHSGPLSALTSRSLLLLQQRCCLFPARRSSMAGGSACRFVRITTPASARNSIGRRYTNSMGKGFSSVLPIPSGPTATPYHPRAVDLPDKELADVPLDTQPPAQVRCKCAVGRLFVPPCWGCAGSLVASGAQRTDETHG